MTDLRPCPFCGGEAELLTHIFTLMPNSYGVKCRVCEAETRQFYQSAEEARDAWNRRNNDGYYETALR